MSRAAINIHVQVFLWTYELPVFWLHFQTGSLSGIMATSSFCITTSAHPAARLEMNFYKSHVAYVLWDIWASRYYFLDHMVILSLTSSFDILSFYSRVIPSSCCFHVVWPQADTSLNPLWQVWFRDRSVTQDNPRNISNMAFAEIRLPLCYWVGKGSNTEAAGGHNSTERDWKWSQNTGKNLRVDSLNIIRGWGSHLA